MSRDNGPGPPGRWAPPDANPGDTTTKTPSPPKTKTSRRVQHNACSVDGCSTGDGGAR